MKNQGLAKLDELDEIFAELDHEQLPVLELYQSEFLNSLKLLCASCVICWT